MSWTGSFADERLTVNRLLFSLNSCLSTSLIKTRGWQRKIKAANETNISARLLKSQRGERQFTRSPKGGDIQQHMSMCEGIVVSSTLDFRLQLVNQDQLG